MTWQQNIFQILIVTSSAGSPTGFFEYSGTPVLGNPPIAYATAPGVTQDPFGNALPVTTGGFVSVNTTFMVAALRAAGLQFHHPGTDFGVAIPGVTEQGSNTAGATLTLASGAATGATNSQLILNDSIVLALGRRLITANTDQVLVSPTNVAPTTTAALEVQGAIQTTSLNSIIANGNLQSQLGDALISAGNVNITTAGKGVLRTGETWHVVGAGGQPPFLNSFTAGGTAPRFQVEAVGGGRVRLSGAVNTGAVTAANTAIFTLPAGYQPSRTLAFVTPNNVTAYTLGQASVQVITTGDVQLVPAGTAGKFVLLDGICFELD